MSSFEEWEKRQQSKGRLPRRRPSTSHSRPRTEPTHTRTSPVTVVLPGRSFGDWVFAGIGIGVGLCIVSVVVGIVVGIFSVCVGFSLTV